MAEPLVGLLSLGFDAVLLGFEHLLGDGVAVVEVDELLLLVAEVSEAPAVFLGVSLRDL